MVWRVLSVLLFFAMTLTAEAGLTSWSTSNYLRRLSAVMDNTATGKPFVLSAWYYLTATATNRTGFCIGQTGGILHSQALDVNTAAGLLARERDGATNAANTQTTVPTSTWFHAAGGFVSSSSRRTYLNGTGGDNGSALGTVNASNSAYVGTSCGSGAPWESTGAIAEVSGWDCCANATDRNSLVTKLAGGDNPLAITAEAAQPWTGTLIFYWPLNTTADINDLGPTGTHDLTMVGTLTNFASHPPVDAAPGGAARRRGIVVNALTPWPFVIIKEWLDEGYRRLTALR